MGMKSQKVTVGPKNVIDVTLKEEMNRLEEAVAVGYGTTKVKDIKNNRTIYRDFKYARKKYGIKIKVWKNYKNRYK